MQDIMPSYRLGKITKYEMNNFTMWFSQVYIAESKISTNLINKYGFTLNILFPIIVDITSNTLSKRNAHIIL